MADCGKKPPDPDQNAQHPSVNDDASPDDPSNNSNDSLKNSPSPRRVSTDTPKCSLDACHIEDNEKNKLQCNQCKRDVHYRCTSLPLYQISQFLKSGYRNYICITCTKIPARIQNIIPRPPQRSKDKETVDLESLVKSKEAEVDVLAETNRILQSKVKELTEELSKCTTKSQKEKENNAKLSADFKTMKKGILNYEKEITDLKSEINEKEKQLNDNCADNESLNVSNLTTLMSKKFEEVEKNLKESLLDEVNKQNEKLESKINEILTTNRTVSSDPDTPITEAINNSVAPPDLRSIMREQQNEQLVEERDKKQRSCNLVIHGFIENHAENKGEAKKTDEDFVKAFINDVGLDIAYKSLFRLGSNEGKQGPYKRPLKIVLSSEEEKDSIMANLRKLKGKEKYIGISVKEDYTVQERELIKEWVEKAKDANTNEGGDSEYEWRVRGSPKNGLMLKRFRKRNYQH